MSVSRAILSMKPFAYWPLDASSGVPFEKDIVRNISADPGGVISTMASSPFASWPDMRPAIFYGLNPSSVLYFPFSATFHSGGSRSALPLGSGDEPDGGARTHVIFANQLTSFGGGTSPVALMGYSTRSNAADRRLALLLGHVASGIGWWPAIQLLTDVGVSYSNPKSVALNLTSRPSRLPADLTGPQLIAMKTWTVSGRVYYEVYVGDQLAISYTDTTVESPTYAFGNGVYPLIGGNSGSSPGSGSGQVMMCHAAVFNRLLTTQELGYLSRVASLGASAVPALTGKVTYADSSPAAGATVRAYRRSDGALIGDTVAGADGTYTMATYVPTPVETFIQALDPDSQRNAVVLDRQVPFGGT